MGDVYMVNGKILSGLPNHAKDIIFDNDGTTLSSTNTEDAIKEVNSNLVVKRHVSKAIEHNFPGFLSVTPTSGYTLVSAVSTDFNYVTRIRVVNNAYSIYLVDGTGSPAAVDTVVEVDIFEMKV